MALLGRELTVVLRDGREAAIRSARPGDARALSRLLDAIAAEPEVTLLMRPGEISAREWRRRIAAAVERETSLFLLRLARRPPRRQPRDGRRRAPRFTLTCSCVGMSVARDCRGLGVGGALLESALAVGGAGGALKVELSVFAHNAPAISFYERHGFAREGLRRRQLVRAGEYHDEVLMARFLDPEP